MMLHANEEISRWRSARKVMRLPRAAAGAEGEIWLCVCCYPKNKMPLELRVNGRHAVRIAPQPDQAGSWTWVNVALRRGVLRGGVNEIVLCCDSPAMNAWMLGIENGHRAPKSFLSVDREKSWRNERMGACGTLRGEYLIRVRVDTDGLREQRVPPIVYENPRHPRVRELRDLVPKDIRAIREPWRQVLALRNWVARAWTYEAFGRNYAPWDPWTVLAWKRDEWGHGRDQPIAMCVHYGMVFCSLASALGHTSRGVAITQNINSPHGHFMTEIWDRERAKWIAHDANFDAHYEIDGSPLSARELADVTRSRRRPASIRFGGGFTSDSPRLNTFLNDKLRTGKVFAEVALWRRNDVISDPAAAPPSHGSVVYCETDLIWYSRQECPVIAPMFPYRADADYFNAPPTIARRRA